MLIPINNIDDLRKVFQKEGFSEEEIREGFYNANPNLKRPDEKVECIVQMLCDNQSQSQGGCLS